MWFFSTSWSQANMLTPPCFGLTDLPHLCLRPAALCSWASLGLCATGAAVRWGRCTRCARRVCSSGSLDFAYKTADPKKKLFKKSMPMEHSTTRSPERRALCSYVGGYMCMILCGSCMLVFMFLFLKTRQWWRAGWSIFSSQRWESKKPGFELSVCEYEPKSNTPNYSVM